MKLNYVFLSAALVSTSTMAGDFRSLGTLPATAMEDSHLAKIEGGNPCEWSWGSMCFTVQKISQDANTNQGNLAVFTKFTKQSNSALTMQSANNSIQ